MPARSSIPDRDPAQDSFSFGPAEVTPRGDGSYLVRPGKPVQWLWVKEAARLHRVSADAIRDWITAGLVTGKRVGRRKYQVEAESLAKFIRPDNWRE